MKHIPTPYETKEHADNFISLQFDGGTLGTIDIWRFGVPGTPQEARDTAAFVKLACNVHDELLAACKRLCMGPAHPSWAHHVDLAREVIAKAEADHATI